MTAVAYAQMVALGSSFAAGPGVEPVLDKAAMRSGRNSAQLVRIRLGATLVDGTVSGATTATILNKVHRVTTRVFAPQLESVHAGIDLATVTVGGSDLGYLGGVLSTALLGQASRWRPSRPLADLIRGRRFLRPVTEQQQNLATDGLLRIVNGERARAPEVRVVLMDYLPVFSDSTTAGPGVPLTDSELEHFRGCSPVRRRPRSRLGLRPKPRCRVA